jgi:deoxycytidine triphosphate deaminase
MTELPPANLSGRPQPGPDNQHWKYEDPNKDASRKGLLLSNEIERFCKKGFLIEDYSPERVRPASYTLTIGPDYVDSGGRIQKMGQDDKEPGYFYMEPNSIVYVSSAESLNLPFYIAARFNLRVKWVYKGVLLGTGPQVDPGFKGHLSCPLFNLTNRAVRIRLGDEFATIDFERTTDFCQNRPWDEVKETFEVREQQDVVRVDEENFFMFKQKAFLPLHHLPDYDIVSSLVQLHEEVKTWRIIGVGVVIAFVSLALTLLNFQNNLYRENRVAAQQIEELKRKLDNPVTAPSHTPATEPGLEQLQRSTPTKDIGPKDKVPKSHTR